MTRKHARAVDLRRRQVVMGLGSALVASSGLVALGPGFVRLGQVGDAVGADARAPSAPRSARPTAPGALTAVAADPGAVALQWRPAYDDVKVSSVRVERDGQLIEQLAGNAVSYTDTRCVPGATHTYRVVAVDGEGNTTPTATDVAVAVPAARLVDDFETSSDQWQFNGLALQRQVVQTGTAALAGITTDGQTTAVRQLSSTAADLTCQVSARYDDKDPAVSLTLLRLARPDGDPVCAALVSPTGRLAVRVGNSSGSVVSGLRLERAQWHAVSLQVANRGGRWLAAVRWNGAAVNGISDVPLGDFNGDVASLQLGEAGRRRSYSLYLDRLVVWN